MEKQIGRGFHYHLEQFRASKFATSQVYKSVKIIGGALRDCQVGKTLAIHVKTGEELLFLRSDGNDFVIDATNATKSIYSYQKWNGRV